MANWETLQINTEVMEVGKFYRVFTDSNATTLLLPMENEYQKVEINNLRYMEIHYNNNIPLVQLWEYVRNDEGLMKARLAHAEICVYEKTDSKYLSLETTIPFNGFVIIK